MDRTVSDFSVHIFLQRKLLNYNKGVKLRSFFVILVILSIPVRIPRPLKTGIVLLFLFTLWCKDPFCV